MDNIIRLRLAWIGNAPVYGVVHGVSGYYPCNAKINGGSWLQKIVVWSLRQTVPTGASIRDTAISSFQCRKTVRGVFKLFQDCYHRFWWRLLWRTPPGRGSDKICDSKSSRSASFYPQLRSKKYSTRAILLGYLVISRQYPIFSAKQSAQFLNSGIFHGSGSNNSCDSQSPKL